jgi:hypothetical protein
VQLDYAFGYGEPKPGAALFLGVRAVYLVKFLENPCLFRLRDPGSRVGDGNREHTIGCLRRNANLTLVRELDSVANQIQQNLRDASLVASTYRHLT